MCDLTHYMMLAIRPNELRHVSMCDLTRACMCVYTCMCVYSYTNVTIHNKKEQRDLSELHTTLRQIIEENK